MNGIADPLTKPKIVIWESHSTLEGGQKVSLNILDALRDTYECIFFVPEEGALTDKIKQRGTAFSIIPTGSYSEGEKGLKDIAKLLYLFPKAFIGAYLFLKRNNIRLIYSNGSRTFIFSAIIGSFLSIPVIWHVHNFFNDKKTKSILELLGRLKHLRKIISVSSAVEKQFPLLGAKSEVVYNSFNIAEFAGTPRGPYIREKFAIPPAARIISTISWISKPKNTEVLIKSVPHILEQCENVHFLIAGGIKKGHKEYYDYLLDLAVRTGIRDHITFAGHCSDIPNLLIDVHINCITSLEACPLIVPESYFSAVPVIGPDTGGTPELIKDGQTGLIYRFNDKDDLADKISRLVKNEALYNTMRKHCRDYVSRFDTANFNEQIKAVAGSQL